MTRGGRSGEGGRRPSTVGISGILAGVEKSSYLCKRKRRPSWPHTGAYSSAGLEHLPYKQGVIGSNPIGPTTLDDFSTSKAIKRGPIAQLV